MSRFYEMDWEDIDHAIEITPRGMTYDEWGKDVGDYDRLMFATIIRDSRITQAVRDTPMLGIDPPNIDTLPPWEAILLIPDEFEDVTPSVVDHLNERVAEYNEDIDNYRYIMAGDCTPYDADILLDELME